MSTARRPLPQLSGDFFITDGGIETDLIFHRGLRLPHFAAFVLLDELDGRRGLRDYYREYLTLAREREVGAVLDTPTWRASADWGALLGYSSDRLADINRRAVELLEELRSDQPAIVISGSVGPRADGHEPDRCMTASAAAAYHAPQIQAFAATGADMVTALTLSYAAEAIGIVRAATVADIPAAISFTVETDGRLPDGSPLLETIEEVDAQTQGAAVYFMVNCAHPVHFANVLRAGGASAQRIRGLRANASLKSHAELDESDELDEGDPLDLARHIGELSVSFPHLTVLGGCCGTDRRHLAAICDARPAAAGE